MNVLKLLPRKAVTVSVLVGSVAGYSSVGFAQSEGIRVRTVSAPAEVVSGGSVLAEVLGGTSSGLAVRLNGQAVNADFRRDPRSGRTLVLVKNLREGENVIAIGKAVANGFVAKTKIAVNNHNDPAGQILGPHQRPWICETEASGLGAPPASGPCQAQSRYDWFYKSSDGTFKPLKVDTDVKPSDVVKTKTSEGKTVDYIVRVESGVIDESIFRIAILDNPSSPINNPWSATGKGPGDGWNGNLSWQFVGGAGPGNRSGSNDVKSALQDVPLSLGYAVAFGTRNTLNIGSDDVVSAETVIMLKQYFTEHYGVPRFTISNGSSGGSMQQRLIANNYPGLLDAIVPTRTFPDLYSIAFDVMDCRLLVNYYKNANSASAWSGERISAVDGFAVATKGKSIGQTTCQNSWLGYADTWPNADGSAQRRDFLDTVPPSFRYDPTTNRGGARVSIWDRNVLSVGVDPATGFARPLYDNTGVQYGLRALNSGAISVSEFLDLNDRIGGLDPDGNITASRSHGDVEGIKNAFRYGRIDEAENLNIPTIELRNYTDDIGDVHTKQRTFAFLERLKKAHGTTANMVEWTIPMEGSMNLETLDRVALVTLDRMALLGADEWLQAIAKDKSSRSTAQKVIADKPASLIDGCWDQSGKRIDEKESMSPDAACNKLFPIYSNVRVMAGGPLAGDVLKCHTTKPKASDYRVKFTEAEWQKLLKIFPEGVCDWSRPSIGRVPLAGTWLKYSRPGVGKPLRMN